MRKNIEAMVLALEDIGVTKDGTPELFHDLAAYIGTKTREHDPDWWVQRRSKETECVFDDCRFANEDDDVRTFYLVPFGWTPERRPGLSEDAATEEYNRDLPADPAVRVTNPVDKPECAADEILRRCGWEETSEQKAVREFVDNANIIDGGWIRPATQGRCK